MNRRRRMQDFELVKIFKSNVSREWNEYLISEFSKDYMKGLETFLREQLRQDKVIYPKADHIFNALKIPLSQIKVVIFGQDPYHGENQAHGLSFSVESGLKIPPSLKNIYKEIHSDLGLDIPVDGNLDCWAKQGVLLLNTVLTVEASKAGSHQKKGWEHFTDKIIEVLNTQREGVIFLLWGSHAQKKASQIDSTRHIILEAPHPSPLSAHRGFFGCKHFSITNNELKKQGKDIVDWRVG